jgi:hypothetical protein
MIIAKADHGLAQRSEFRNGAAVYDPDGLGH